MTDQSRRIHFALRFFALAGAAFGILYVLNNFLIFWGGWPGILGLLSHIGLASGPAPALSTNGMMLGAFQLLVNSAIIIAIGVWVWRTPTRSAHADADVLSDITAYIIRSCFWAVLLIGLADGTISFLRVEGLLSSVVGPQLAEDLGRTSFRGQTVHYPLLAVGFIIGAVTRSLGFTWLAVLIVVAEFQIVITRFVFSYEQAFMGDLVRFWYAALFLFASAYTLLEEGHVRVDIFYNNLSERGKAWSNVVGSLTLGIPVCWVILTRGMWGKSNLINAPLLNYEGTQSGYGMYVKYLMAGFLIVYALSMLIQFFSFFLANAGTLLRERNTHPHPDHPAEI